MTKPHALPLIATGLFVVAGALLSVSADSWIDWLAATGNYVAAVANAFTGALLHRQHKAEKPKEAMKGRAGPD